MKTADWHVLRPSCHFAKLLVSLVKSTALAPWNEADGRCNSLVWFFLE